jgi:hypothetical protein
MPGNEQRKLAGLLASRGIPLIIDEVYHPLYHGPLNHGADGVSATNIPNTIVLGDFAKAMSIPDCALAGWKDADAARREALLDLRSYFTISGSPLTEAIGARAGACGPDPRAASIRVAGQSFIAEQVHAPASRRARLDRRPAAHVLSLAARRPRCASAVRGAGEGRRVGGARRLPTCRRTCVGVGAVADGYQGARHFPLGARWPLIAREHIGKIVGLDKSPRAPDDSARNQNIRCSAPIMTTSNRGVARERSGAIRVGTTSDVVPNSRTTAAESVN